MIDSSFTEVWKPISGFEGLYEVSSLGNVKTLEREIYNAQGKLHYRRKERLLKVNGSRYPSVVLCKDGKIYPKAVHRLVAQAFIPNPENKPFIDHIDTDPYNNRVDNLRWVTQQENCLNPLTRIHNSESKKGHRGYLTHHTEETKRKISLALKGKPFTKEHIQHSVEAKKAKRRLAV